MDPNTLTELLRRVAEGERSVQDAVSDLQHLPYEALLESEALVDHHRELRTGAVEAVYAPGKTLGQVQATARALTERATGAVFVTRATPEQAAAVAEVCAGSTYDERSRLVVVRRATLPEPLAVVAVVSAGTSDQPVAEEAAQTADALGMDVLRVADVGVAGLPRLLEARPVIEAADCVIVVAGMEGALPSVISGMTSRPIIGVPTSVGYGAAFEGMAALLAMLTGCAPGVAVVNIDNGFGAAQVAHRIAHTAIEMRDHG